MQKETDSLNTPAMKQFAEIKKNHPDGILFFRMGDFYEMFLDDAILASKILGITLTKRQNSIPMCGFPYHSTETHISKLISAGKKVVICEQKKSDSPGNKLMSREVVRVITPGTLVEENLLSSFENNYFSCIEFENQKIKLSFADVSTSDLFFIEIDSTNKIFTYLKKFSPKEILLIKEEEFYYSTLELEKYAVLTKLENLDFKKTDFKFNKLQKMIETYIEKNFQSKEFFFKNPIILEETEFLEIDEDSIKNLDLIENQNSNSKQHSLFNVLNFCRTSSGKRHLKNRILFPFKNKNSIESIWNKLEILKKEKKNKTEIEKKLLEFGDIERIISRFRASKASPRDFKTILKNIEICFEIKNILESLGFEFILETEKLIQVKEFIENRLFEGELPIQIGNESQFIKSEFNEKLDRAREAKTKGKDWILDLEEKEKKNLSLNTFKIRYNRVVGFYVELSRKEAEFAPKSYFKKQTLVTSERFTFPELEEIERTILQSDEIIFEIEKFEFEEMIKSVLKEYKSFYNLANQIGELDYILSLNDSIEEYSWTRPEINLNSSIDLIESRHPVIEKFLGFGERFVANDVKLDSKDESIAILTGPNMAGKSTFMRQIALCQILFQMGSYVPAKKSSFSIVDKIFTRIGSGDDITTGQSTFYVEMKETANILNKCTKDSLILFDEIGRGTSTYDGMSIAWSIIEFLSKKEIRPKTIFATHYHELTELENFSGVFNLFLDTLEENDEILFLKKVKKGIAKKSFGIYVAKLAGIPNEVIERAQILLKELESQKKDSKKKKDTQLLLPLTIETNLPETKIKEKLKNLNLNLITPIESLKILEELKSLIDNDR